jgi:hypothetical protein
MRSARFLLSSSMLLLVSAGIVAAETFPEVSKLPAHPALPDPLVMWSGERVVSKQQWMEQRRPELKALFEHYMYGRRPPAPEVEASLDRVDTKAFGGKATMKVVTLSLGPDTSARMSLLLVVPNERTGPAPAFVGPNFCGNHTVLGNPAIPLPSGWVPSFCAGSKTNKATEAARGTQINTWAIEQTIDRGYAVATFYNGDVEPDRPGAPEGVRAHYAGFDWGAIAAWAWGVSRAVDYLVKDKDIDPARIAVVGHSRNGKAALLAAAFDERIALAIPLQAGCGGTAPSRGKIGESVQQINDRFPHWFNERFKEFNTQPERLPFDQHALIALCAPRPVLLPNAVEDTWANPAGQFEMLVAAEPVYRLLGAGGLGARQMPEPGRLIDSVLGYYIRPGKHSMTPEDWEVFLDFTDKHFQRPER